MTNERETLIAPLRDELPKCGRHRDASHIDCVECMYLSTKVYAPLEQIEAELQECRAWIGATVMMVELNALDAEGIEGIRRTGKELLDG